MIWADRTELVMPHPPTDGCADDHCYFHHEDEPLVPGSIYYIVCGECMHLYRTAGELERAYVENMPQPGPDANGFVWPEIRPQPAEEIFFCPYCAHNF